MLTKRYLPSVKNVPAIMAKIVEGTAPAKFTISHLRGLGFKSSNDNTVIPLLKDLGFLSDDGTPTSRYHDYRDKSRSKIVMAEALREAYEGLFHISEKPGMADRSAIEGKLKSEHNTTDRLAQLGASTFYAFLKLADLDTQRQLPQKKRKSEPKEREPKAEVVEAQKVDTSRRQFAGTLGLRYNVEVHLPASKDIEVYNAIFKSLKEHLLED